MPGVMPETGDFWANEAGYHGHVKTLANRAEDSSVCFFFVEEDAGHQII